MARNLSAVRTRDVVAAARARGASDVHLIPSIAPVLRVDGSLERLQGGSFSASEIREVVQEMIPAGCGQDATVSLHDDELGVLRVHVLRASGECAIAIRLLANSAPSLESLGIPDAISAFAARRNGLLLFGGPTGSGKSTTMAALVDRINLTSARRIITIEDPIEYRYSMGKSVVSQRQIGDDTSTLADALRGALRSDPDVIVVGEMRDRDAIRGALTAAETGHLVLATLHAGNASQMIERVADAFDGSEQASVRSALAGTLIAAVAQRLERRGTGTGRVALIETLVGTDAVRNLIREGKHHQLKNAIATGRQFGMQTFEQHHQELVRDGGLVLQAGLG